MQFLCSGQDPCGCALRDPREDVHGRPPEIKGLASSGASHSGLGGGQTARQTASSGFEKVQKFEDSLLPHQKATGPDGSTVLERAVLQHNVLAASRAPRKPFRAVFGRQIEERSTRTCGCLSSAICSRRVRDIYKDTVEIVISRINIVIITYISAYMIYV